MAFKMLPLTIGQKSIAHVAQKYPNSAVNNIGGLVLLEDELDFDLVKKTLRLCVERNDALRLQIVKKKKGEIGYEIFFKDVIHQYIADIDSLPVDVAFMDFTGQTMEKMDETLMELNTKPIDIYNGPLYEFTMIKAPDGRQGIFTKIDHMATDAWMSMMLTKEVIEVYYALKNNKELPPAAYPFTSSIEAEQAYLKSPQYKADRQYWMEKFTTKPHPSYMAGSDTFPASKDGKSKRLDIGLGESLTGSINAFCSQYGISPVAVFNKTMGIYLTRVTNCNDVLFCDASMLRSTIREKTTCGPLVNSILNRIIIDQELSFLDSCRETHSEHMSMLRHVHYPILHLIGEVMQKYHMDTPCDTFLSFQVARIQIRENIKFETKWYPSGTFASPFTMNITDMDNSGCYIIQYEYQTEPFSEERVRQIHDSFFSIMQKGIAEPETPVKNL